MRPVALRIAAIVVAGGVGIAGLLLARPLGTAVGTPKDPTEPTVESKKCPFTVPDGCRDLAAQMFHLDVSQLPTIADQISGLRFRGGKILIRMRPSQGPILILDFETTTTHRFLELGVSRYATLGRDTRPILLTPLGRKVRNARTRERGTLALVFYDQRLAYVVSQFLPSGMDPALLAAAERLADAVRPATRIVGA